MSTEHYQYFNRSLAEIRLKVSHDRHINQLLLAHVITVFEYYLLSIAANLVQADKKLLIRLAESRKFRNHTVTIAKALTNDMQKYMVSMLKNLLFHNLSEVEPLFRETFDVHIRISKEMVDLVNVRHDLIHRNGYTKTGEHHAIDESRVLQAVAMVELLVKHIDEQVIQKYHTLPGLPMSPNTAGE